MIYCLLEIGTLNSTVLLPDGTQTAVPINDLACYMLSFTNNYNTNKIKLIGNNLEFLQGFREKILQEEINKYNNNRLEIEMEKPQ